MTHTSQPDNGSDDNHLIAQRREKLAKLREQGNAFPNDFRRDALAAELHRQYAEYDQATLVKMNVQVNVAGRMLAKRVMGKTSFTHLQDMSGRIQLYLRRDELPDGVYQAFKSWDIGDILAATGTVYKTQTGELSIQVTQLNLLTKSLRPLPEKYHGLTDTEQRYRQRYVDLIMNPDVRRTFQQRIAIIQYIRAFFIERGFLEVETPMMHAIPGGATARPFVTHHNALDIPMYLRVAPELFLKRLVVGGFEKVFEINRNFRNEGVSTQHNPEFTMLEFYQAYSDYQELMHMTETLLRGIAQQVIGDTSIRHEETVYDFAQPFARMTVVEAILHYHPNVQITQLQTLASLRQLADQHKAPYKDSDGVGKLQMALFEATVEQRLLQPTFITAFPTEVSPLARRNDNDPTVTDRFELFIGGREIANGFSELNDAEDQAERFRQQVIEKDAGDDEAMHYDADYIRALEYGLPPTAGEGIGIDRLVMLFTNSPSIRDVLLFPYLRPE